MRLSELRPGQRAEILECRCDPVLSGRLEDLGLTEGLEVKCLHRAPAGSPAAYEIRGAAIALRTWDAEQILIREAAT